MVHAETGDAAPEMPHAQAIAQDLEALRKLAMQLQRMAASADDTVLRAILGKREALLDAIRSRLAESNAAAADSGARRRLSQTVAEIAEMDQQSARLLKERAVAVAAEIEKLRAGRKWRESCPR